MAKRRAGTDRHRLALTRHDASGNLDSSFGSGGIATTDFGGAGDEAHDAALMADGGIIAVGETDAPGIEKQDFALARYRPDGTLDSSFGAGGKTTTDFGALSDDAVRGLAIQPDGRIVAAGWNGDEIELARYLVNGQLDPTFGAGGIAPTGVSTEMGRGVVVGHAGSSTIFDMGLLRNNPDGTLDTTFGANGKLVTDFHGRGDSARDVAFDAASRIIAGGYTANGSDTEFALLRANP